MHQGTLPPGSDSALTLAGCDASGVASVVITLDGEAVKTFTAPPFEAQIDASEGSHQLAAKAIDTAGNEASASVAITISGSAGDAGPSKGSLGDPCSGDGECTSGLCRSVPGDEARFCTQSCAANACPSGSDCIEVDAESICTAPPAAKRPEDGCALAPGAKGGAGTLVSLLMLLLLLTLRAPRRR